jgi:receptor protein-tyrosine kinase
MSKTLVLENSLPEFTKDRSRAIGAILVELGRLSPLEVEKIQQFASKQNLRFGDAALKLQLLTEDDVNLAVAQQFKYPILRKGGEGGVSDEVIAAYQPQSVAVEALRVLRSQLGLRWNTPNERKSLVILSSDRGDGRSWLAANLATVFAQMGDRVLLIDGDMRHPRQHELFKLNNSVGLSALLTGRAGKEAVVRIHPQLRLFVLPAGFLPPNPQELLGREVFDLVLKMFASQYDLVIFDAPATSEAADAQILASRVDAGVMLVRRNYSRAAQVKSAMQNMAESGIHVIGSVINEYGS